MKRDESQNVEYKRSWHDEYLKWVCGFANAKGGTIWIGIDETAADRLRAHAIPLPQDAPLMGCGRDGESPDGPEVHVQAPETQVREESPEDDHQNLDTEAWFDKRLQKVVSLAAASATYWFNST